MITGQCSIPSPGINANIFFVDQLIGTGFSRAGYGKAVSTTEEAAKDIAAFMAVFFENFTQFKGHALRMTSESYESSLLKSMIRMPC